MCETIYGQEKAARFIEVESMYKELHDKDFAIVEICILYRITLNMCQLPRNKTWRILKMYDPDDLEIDQRMFTLFNRMWGS